MDKQDVSLNTSVTPQGRFVVGVHFPSYTVANLRQLDCLCSLGRLAGGEIVDNRGNFPSGAVEVPAARRIYEIRNPLPFRGCTFIDSGWADARARAPELIRIASQPQVSMRASLAGHCPDTSHREIITRLPRPLRCQLAASSTDPQELVWLAESCCRMLFNDHGQPSGLCYAGDSGRPEAMIEDMELFETLANNPHLPDAYKVVMVLRPGVQGGSEIVGDFRQGSTEIFEYLRANSYIPWGHYAANFAHTAIRYRVGDLSETDMRGLRHLFYQRIYVSLAAQLGLEGVPERRMMSEEELESLRLDILSAQAGNQHRAAGPATLWGWNFGYDYSGSGYRLHASHQMIHQQYALVPELVETSDGISLQAFSCGDQVAEVTACYRSRYQSDFFNDYIKAIRSNARTDQQPGESSLVIWEDEHVLLFVPKAQVSQWEMQLMVTAESGSKPVGNVLEATAPVRRSLDRAMLIAQQVLAGLGATMVTSIEYSKRIGLDNGQRLIYAFLPKLPWSMGAFSEAQGRYILGHYPEDFAVACRRQMR